MPGTQRRTQSGLIDRLIDEPHRFNFFQAVRLLDLWLRRCAPVHGKTLDSVLRFKNSVSLRFPPSQIEAFTVIADAVDAGAPDGPAVTGLLEQHRLRHIHITPAFMGFLGVNGVLPYDYTATIAAQIAFEKKEAGRAFFDSFSHRSMLLFYRAWAKCRIECRGDADDRDSFLGIQLALAGRPRHPARLPAGPAATACAPDRILPDEVAAR
jgi:type VI secretion system protein ImpH